MQWEAKENGLGANEELGNGWTRDHVTADVKAKHLSFSFLEILYLQYNLKSTIFLNKQN